MKYAAIIAVATMLTVHAQARPELAGLQPVRQVTAFLNSPPAMSPVIRLRAKALASQMFAEIGVNLTWRMDEHPRHTNPIIITVLSNDTSECGHALACAYPYQGTHIHIFWNRIWTDQFRPGTAHILLAHVIVHEITHLLEGLEHHSAEGIMKARWTLADRAAMKKRHLRFSPDDLLLLRNGMDARDARSITSADLELANLR